MSYRIFGLWTGENPMPDIRKRCFESFNVTGLEPILITRHNICDWILPHSPLHEAYEYLSPIHKSDYLRAYLLLHHGGGYADIKTQTGSWLPAVEKILRSKRLMGGGYRQQRGGMPWLQNNVVQGKTYVYSMEVPRIVAKLATNTMRGLYRLLIGPSAFYFKPNTIFAKLWMREVERRLDILLPDLKRCPPCHPRDRLGGMLEKESLAGVSAKPYAGYPVPWSFILADIEEPMSLAFSWALCRDIPPPRFDNYL